MGSTKGNEKGDVVWSETQNPDKTAPLGETNGHGDYTALEDGKDGVSTSPARKNARDHMASSWLVWSVFVISITAGASSSAVILLMQRAAPISLAGWRHQVSALVLLPCFVYQWSRMPKVDSERVLIPRNVGLYCTSAFALACHFACYIWALDHTSVTHCMVLICTPPIFVALHTQLTGDALLGGELVGVSFGLLGVVILQGGTRVEKDNLTTFRGDAMALCSAIWMAVYLIVGKKLRCWVPLFVYQFPVALLTAIILGVTGLLLEGWNVSDYGAVSGPFTWLTRKDYFLGTVFMGVGPGVLGHAGYSFVIKYVSPLVIPTGFSLQPIMASVLCWAIGLSPIPGIWTCLGGAVTLSGTLSVSCATAHRMKKLKVQEEYQHPGPDEEEPLLQCPSELP